MAKLLEFEAQDGPVTVAVRTEPGEVSAIAWGSPPTEKIGERLDDALAIVGRLSRTLGTVLADSGATEATVELGLQFTGKGTVVVVEASAQATLSISLTYKS